MPDEAVGSEQSLESQLESLLGSDAPKAPAAGKGVPQLAIAGAPAASPETPATTEADPLEKALEDIKEDVEEKKETPALSDEQASILAAIPNAEAAANLYAVAQNYSNFTNAFEQGDFANVQSMFEEWNPAAFEGFLDHIYQQKVASGEWVDRFIADQEGTGKQHKGMKSLEQKVAQLQAQLNQREQGNQQTKQQEQQQQSFANYTKHIDSLFEQIKFSPADRRWVTADLNGRITSDPKVLEAIKKGDVNAANRHFKAAIRDYVNRDKQTTAATDAKIDLQNQKKPLISGGAGQPETGALPDDVKQVPKGQEESWMNQQLEKLFKSKKK